jgi:hypothetical protein
MSAKVTTRNRVAAPALMQGRNGLIEGHERSFIAQLMSGHDACDKLLHRVWSEVFSVPHHRAIIDAIRDVHDERDEINHVTVSNRLAEKGKLAECGSIPGIIEIALSTTSAEIAESALECMLEDYRAREAAKIGKQLVAGQITAVEAQDALAKLNQHRQQEKSWTNALDESVVTSSDLRDLELTPRRKLLADWFCEGDLGFIFAFRGVGKTWLALAVAQALSTGGKLGDWQALASVKVLYVDGEMPPDLMRARCEGLQASNTNLEFLNHEILFDRTGKTLNITSREVQQAITGRCVNSHAKVLILDNLSTLASGMKENEADSWELVNNWLLDLRRRKIAVVIVHHAGRSGEMRGTSKREDNVFWIIALDDAKKEAADKRGARFISRFTKPSRNTQEEIPPYEWHLVTDEASGLVSIGHRQAHTLEIFRSVIEAGVTKCDEIAAEMKLPKYTVSRLAKKAVDAGWLKKSRGEYVLTEAQK